MGLQTGQRAEPAARKEMRESLQRKRCSLRSMRWHCAPCPTLGFVLTVDGTRKLWARLSKSPRSAACQAPAAVGAPFRDRSSAPPTTSRHDSRRRCERCTRRQVGHPATVPALPPRDHRHRRTRQAARPPPLCHRAASGSTPDDAAQRRSTRPNPARWPRRVVRVRLAVHSCRPAGHGARVSDAARRDEWR